MFMLFIVAFATTFYLLIDEHVSNIADKPQICLIISVKTCEKGIFNAIYSRVSIQRVSCFFYYQSIALIYLYKNSNYLEVFKQLLNTMISY